MDLESCKIALEDASKRVKKFSTNTKKSAGRLQDVSDIQSRLELLEQYWKTYCESWSCFNKAVRTSGKNVEEDDEVEIEYLRSKGELVKMIRDIEEAAHQGGGNNQEVHGAGVQRQADQVDVRVKAIEPPTFSGELEDWVSFKDLFTSVISTNGSLSDVHKMQHLRTACKGKSADIIRDFEISAESYAAAWDALKKRYDNERLLVSRLVERLLDLPTMKTECSIELARLLDGTNQLLRSLAVLKRPTDTWDDFLVVQTQSKLDFETRKAWEKSIGSTSEMPTFAKLNEFLSATLRSLEALKFVSQKYHKPSNTSFTNTASTSKRVVHTHVLAKDESRSGCLFCNEPHVLTECHKFGQSSIQNRREFIRDQMICFTCLGTSHLSRHCRSLMNCEKCNRVIIHYSTTRIHWTAVNVRESTTRLPIQGHH